jgi:hypothetical protein
MASNRAPVFVRAALQARAAGAREVGPRGSDVSGQKGLDKFHNLDAVFVVPAAGMPPGSTARGRSAGAREG